MLLATVAVAAFRPGGVGVVGPVPARLPTVQLPALHPQPLRELLLPAFTVLIVGFSDDVATARSFARRGEEIVANRELLALGVANAGSALVHGFPVSSSGTRTAIAVTVGNKTMAYSLAVAAAVLAVLLFAHSLLSRIPTAAASAACIASSNQTGGAARVAVLIVHVQLGGDPRPGSGHIHLHPLIRAREPVLGDQPLMDHRRPQRDIRPQPRVAHPGERGDRLRQAALMRDGPFAGTDAAPSSMYFFTVRQSHPTSAATSADVAPRSSRARKRRMFIHVSAPGTWKQHPSEMSSCRLTLRRVACFTARRNCPGRKPGSVSRRTRTYT